MKSKDELPLLVPRLRQTGTIADETDELVDGYLFEGEHPHTARTQKVANGHIVVETDGVSGYTVWYEGLQDAVLFDLDGTPAYTDVPGRVKLRRSGKDEDLPVIQDAEDVDPRHLEEKQDESRWD